MQVLIAYAGDIGDLALLVEPTRQELGGENGEDDNIVDFGVEVHGEVIRRVQVKASRSPSGLNPLRHSDARDIFDRMGRGGPSAAILTNKPIAKKLLKACGATASGQDGQVVYTRASKRSVEGDVTSSEQSIIYDSRPPAEIKRRVLELMRALRRDNARGQSEEPRHSSRPCCSTMSRVPLNFGGGPVSIRLRSPRHCARRVRQVRRIRVRALLGVPVGAGGR